MGMVIEISQANNACSHRRNSLFSSKQKQVVLFVYILFESMDNNGCYITKNKNIWCARTF